jgi:hypothetical protein
MHSPGMSTLSSALALIGSMSWRALSTTAPPAPARGTHHAQRAGVKDLGNARRVVPLSLREEDEEAAHVPVPRVHGVRARVRPRASSASAKCSTSVPSSGYASSSFSSSSAGAAGGGTPSARTKILPAPAGAFARGGRGAWRTAQERGECERGKLRDVRRARERVT